MTQRNIFLGILGVLTLIAAAYYFFSINHSSDMVLVGTVDANQVVVSSRVAGRIEKLPLQEGTAVKAGDLVAQLDSSELKAQAEAARASIRSMSARIGAASATEKQAQGETSSDVLNAQAHVATTQSQLQQAQADLERVRSETARTVSLEQQGIASRQQGDDARAALKSAQANVQSLRDQVRSAEAQLNMARARTQQAHAAASNVADTRGQLEQAQAQLSEAETRVDYTRVVAPVSGVVSVRAAREGEVVQPGEPIVTLMDLSDTWVRAAVAETYADHISLGDELRVRLPSGDIVTGKVTFKAVEGDFATQRDVSRIKRDIRTVALKVALANPRGLLVPGMTAEVLIPSSKLKSRPGEPVAEKR